MLVSHAEQLSGALLVKFGKLFIVLSFIELKQPTCKFCKYRAKDPPLRCNYTGKIPNFQSFGTVNHSLRPIKVKLNREEQTC